MKKIFGLLFIILFSASTSFAFECKQNPLSNYNSENKKQAMNRLYNFFKSYDTAILKAIIKPVVVEFGASSSDPNIQYMVNKNRELIGILSSLNPISYNPVEMNPNDEMIVYAGLMELYFELKNEIQVPNFVVPWECVGSVLLGAFNVASIIQDFRAAVVSSSTWGALRGLLWRVLKRYAGWWGVAATIIEVYNKCF